MENQSKFAVESKKDLIIILSALGYAIAVNLFLVPHSIYNGGLFGFSQVIRTLLNRAGFDPGFDIASIIYYIMNIPIMIVAWFKISRSFLARTILCLTASTLALSLIPIHAVLPDDRLASTVIGGIISGASCGMYLRMNASGGGFDIIGLLLVKYNKGQGVGRINLIVNTVLYLLCMILFSLDVAIYSMIYTAVCSIVMDKIHTQNVNVEVKIITKNRDGEMEKEIMEQLGRGVTEWYGVGAYTNDESRVLFVIASKYELRLLRHIIREHDPHAFIITNENVRVFGNYVKKV